MYQPIDPLTHMGTVSLTVSNLARSLRYYQQSLGLQLQKQENGVAYCGVGQRPLLRLEEKPGAKRVRYTTGLYHFALLLPTRRDLAAVLHHLAQQQVEVDGFADHDVSEAIYLSDPDGHGIEIYRDRPRAEWEFVDGQIKMRTVSFDMAGVLGELKGQLEPFHHLPASTTMGHVHLHVAHIAEAEKFYSERLGFDLMVRYGTSASFMSAGQYHHHLGLNTWAGVGAPPPPPEALGLQWLEICVPSTAVLLPIVQRLQNVGYPVEERANGYFLQDPSHNGLLLTVS